MAEVPYDPNDPSTWNPVTPEAVVQQAQTTVPKKSLLRKAADFVSSPRTLKSQTVGVDAQGNPVPIDVGTQIPTMLGGMIRPSFKTQEGLINLQTKSAQAALAAQQEAMKRKLVQAQIDNETMQAQKNRYTPMVGKHGDVALIDWNNPTAEPFKFKLTGDAGADAQTMQQLISTMFTPEDLQKGDVRGVINGIKAQYALSGDLDETLSKLTTFAGQRAGQAAIAARQENAIKNRPPTEIGLIQKALQGDTNAAEALKVLQQNRINLAKERGMAFGQGRLWNLQNVIDENGTPQLMTGFSVLERQSQGIPTTPVGKLSANQIMAVQRAQAEVLPQIENVRKLTGAFDNRKDRAVFARLLATRPMDTNDPTGWMGNILNQALAGNELSETGRDLTVGLKGLAEAGSTLRTAMGQHASNEMVNLTLNMLPGAGTPDSKMANKNLDQLKLSTERLLGIPIIKGASPHSSSPQSGIVHFSDGKGKEWDIPKDKVDSFTKLHPEAKRSLNAR